MFENIVGHEKQKDILTRSLASGNISHAYLFFGNNGIGKFSLAKEFAKELLHTDNVDNHPDFKVISKMEDKKDILVEQVRRELIDDVYVVQAAGDRKVYIIDDAETLNIASQNTLLKTLEEPPRYITIILVASNISAFLTTILSRVNQIPFEGVSKDELKQFVYEKYNTSLSDNILDYLDGSIGNAISLIENNTQEKLLAVDELYLYIKEQYESKTLKHAQDINVVQDDILDYLEYVLYKNNAYSCVKIVENAKNRLKFNGNYDIIIDSMLLRLIDSIKED